MKAITTYAGINVPAEKNIFRIVGHRFATENAVNPAALAQHPYIRERKGRTMKLAIVKNVKPTKLDQLKKITDYSKWVKRPVWKLHQAVCLCVGLEPVEVGPIKLVHPSQIERAISDAGIRDQWRDVYDETKAATMFNELKWAPPVIGNFYLHRQLKPAAFAKWARSKGIMLPPEIAALIKPSAARKGPGRPPKNTDAVKSAGDYAKTFYAKSVNAKESPKAVATSRIFAMEVFPGTNYIDKAVIDKNEQAYRNAYGVSLRAMTNAIAAHRPGRSKTQVSK